MLLILTGDIQTGKTRWLEGIVAELGAHGVRTEGVLAPGIWRKLEGIPMDAPAHQQFEKLGIDNILLPEAKRIRFALRRDLAEGSAILDSGSQSSRAQLGWEILENAIAEVNDHFERLLTERMAHRSPCLLVIDELGRLELERDGGLTGAVALLEDGPHGRSHHALIVVRSSLADIAERRFAGIWGDSQRIAPDDEARKLVLGLMGAAKEG